MTTKEDGSKIVGKTEMKISKESDSLFTSTVETVASTPAERIDGAPHAATPMLKKSDNSLWIKGISPNTKAADLKVILKRFKILFWKLYVFENTQVDFTFSSHFPFHFPLIIK